MSTSLAEQLQRLAVPQTGVFKRDKKRASLLFDPKEAAGLKKDVVYQIGVEGLEELILKNEIFDQFKNTLFHVTSKDFERSVQTTEANDRLNNTIQKFLLYLSPYFLLNCSHKALEWLIHRYSIHEYNRDDVLMLILPYHECNIFVRAVQLLQFKDTRDSFYFLKALQKPGVHLTKNGLLNHAASDSSFLKFVTKYITLLMKHHKKPEILTVTFNYYCSVFTGAIEYSKEVTDDQVSQMLPLILKGLNSPVSDFCAATYVVTARLVAKTSLSKELLDKFVEKLSEVKVAQLKTEASLVLLVLYQSQKDYRDIPSEAVAELSEKEWLPKVLQNLNSSGSFILPFLEVFIKRCTEEGTANDLVLSREIVKKCMEQIKLEDSYVAVFLNCILDSIKPKIEYSEEANDWLIEIIQTLERQYPIAFDKEVYQILSAKQGKTIMRKKKCLSKLLKNTMAYKGRFEVMEKLYHPNSKFRGEAIRYLADNYASLKETDQAFIKNSLLDRLYDENQEVVSETLKVLQKASIIQTDDDFITALIVVSNRCLNDKEKWSGVYTSIVNMLWANTSVMNWEIFLTSFPALLPKTAGDLKYAKKIIRTPFFAQNVLLKESVEKLADCADVESFKKTIFEGLQSSSSWETVRNFLEVLKAIPDQRRDSHHKYTVLLLFSHILPNVSPLDISALVLEILETFCTTKKGVQTDTYLTCLGNMIDKTEKPDIDLGLVDFSTTTTDKQYFVMMSNILLCNKNSYKKVFKAFLEKNCENLSSKINFMLNMCISENNGLKTDFTFLCLTHLSGILKEKSDEIKQLIYIDAPTVPYLLVLLSNSNEAIRKLTFELIDALVDASTRKSNSYFYLLDSLTKHKEEITIDHEQMSLVMFNILDSSNTKGKKHVADLNSIRNHLLKLCCGLNGAPIYLRSGILNLLSHINTFDILEKTSEIALTILQKSPDVVDSFNAVIIGNIIGRIEARVMSKLDFESNTWRFIEKAIKSDKIIIANEAGDRICLSALALNQFEKEIFSVLDEEVMKRLLDLIVEVSSVAQSPEILPAAATIFKHIDLDSTLILDQLVKMRDVRSPKQDLSKRRRISVVPTVDILDTLEWKKGISVLEFIQDKKKIRKAGVLLPVLFDILKKCLDFDEQVAVEYPKQLVLSLILHCCTKMDKGETLSENAVNVELIVQCIRASQNPQTHHHALLVLAHTANLIPTQVLHHMMAIFTFMGSSVLRYDDAYSFQIIARIIDTIIPILVKDNQINSIAEVLRVFVDVLLDVPEHRRMPLYNQLLSRLDAEENLYLFLLLVFESQVLHSSQEKQGKDNAFRRLDIAANISREFSPKIVIVSCIKLMQYLGQLPDEKTENTSGDTFTIITHTPKDFRHFKYLLLKFTASLLASPEFVNQVASLNEGQELLLEKFFKEIIISVLQYIQRITKVAEKAANTPQNNYWKVVLHHSYDILDSINALLTPQMFLLVTKGLMVHNLNTIRRRMLELLNTKLQYNSTFFADCNRNEIYALIPPIISIIESIDGQIEPEQETVVQTALLSLKLLIKSLAAEDPEKFVQILEFITNLIKTGKAQSNVLASLLLCLAELCVNLRAHAIAGLPEFMPAVIKILKRQKHEEAPSVLLRSIVTTIEKILDSMPLFLSSYLEKLLVEISMLIYKWTESVDERFATKLSSIQHKIGSTVPPRVLIPAVEQSYNKLIEKKCFGSVSALMDILSKSLSSLKGSEINSNLPELTNFFLNALKFRTDGDSSLEETNAVEGHIIQALTMLVLKLSESSFRPLYYKIFDWAVRSETRTERIITFYSLSSRVAQSLKGLFVLFAGHFINNAAQILDACNKIKNEELYFQDPDKNILLLEYVLKTLNAVFMYDSQKFINKEKFDVLMQALVDQLENDLGDVVKRNEELLTPCLVNFALATADDALWKQMNYQILLKMRHNSPTNRLVALHCLTEIVKKLGEDFLPLLPETIPFLAELLEDEEESVEKACQKAVQEMEKVLGEPLQKYF